ncbi:pickpocket protein 28-like isoform X1 [Musca domestica]|uniref:Pickpocket protein 28-like isoform X1 n=1 Tax=Musca domestica TaxID=7370 RepID=A0A9J7IBU7_MUSDO|nr:pickpocket protein 28-like isoform X1 [Musca domestica]XP_058979765.1 pickpocket protein 28-like isoform X1 [Musca domestica]XP_058979766.1 pickpocket protein 28-like isoform X1 [Musca domestica]XP_058979767.1 pickpocket protein 28-like isoform X1 [Musca domestica]
MAHPLQQQKLKKREQLEIYCMGNLKKYLRETTLHGLKYLVDNSLNNWEKFFFLSAFVICSITVVNLISNIYAKWESTPVIIGISPHPTPIVKIPLPALTLCNMNQAMYSKVANYTRGSKEYATLQYLCYSEIIHNREMEKSPEFQNNDIKPADFIVKHSQPCSRMIVACQLSSVDMDCSELFREVLTEEGLCCSFNGLHPKFLYKGNYYTLSKLVQSPDMVPIDWNPEKGYPANLPPKYYPRPAYGTGIAMGLSLILNAEVDEYYCSSSSSAGFKINLASPVVRSLMKEDGIIVPLGAETSFRIDAQITESSPAIRSINRRRRQCVFLDEEPLVFYRYYTKTHCENECLSIYFIDKCGCIPFYLPIISPNATICNMSRHFCIEHAKLAHNPFGRCMSRCQTSCFELRFLPHTFSSPLAVHNYTVKSNLLTAWPKEEVQRNIAVVHFYFRESVIHSELKNVYIGFTEFLSNSGGILGLFMGFSFISVAEIVYFLLLRPISKFLLPKRYRKSPLLIQVRPAPKKYKHWLPDEICRVGTKSYYAKREGGRKESNRYPLKKNSVL